MNELPAEAADDSAPPHLSIGVFGPIGRDALGDVLVDFARRHPNVVLSVHEQSPATALSALRQAELDLALLPETTAPGLGVRPVWRDRVMLAVAADHPLAHRPAVSPADLRDQVLLISRRHQGAELHRFFAARIGLAASGLDGILLDAGRSALMERIATSDAVMLVSAGHPPRHAGVVALPIAAPHAAFAVFAYWRAAAAGSPLAALLGRLPAV